MSFAQWPLVTFSKTFVAGVGEHDLLALAAATAYYTTLCLAPLLLLALAVIGMLGTEAQETFIANVGALVGSDGAALVRTITESASERPDLRQLAGWVGAAVLLFGASAVFAQLQLALNRIWAMKNKAYKGARGWLRRRVLSAGVLLSVLFLTLVSFVAQAALGLFLPESVAAAALGWSITFLLYSALFTALYRWLPDGRVPWITAFRGGMLTTVLFMIGRTLIGLYLERTDQAGAFGPAGAVVVWLLWAFYSSLIFLFSAELLYAIAKFRRWGWVDTGDIGSAERNPPQRPVPP